MRFIAIFAWLIALALPAYAQVTAVPDFGATEVDVDALIKERFPRTLAFLEAEFPADHATLMGNIEVIDKQRGEANALLLLAYRQFVELRRKYAPRIVFAPTVAHAKMLGRLAGFYDLVFKTDGPEICGRFAQDGSAALFELGVAGKYARALDEQALVYFEAIAAAIETPEVSEPVKPEDWNFVMRRMVSAGAPPSFATTIARGNRGDRDLCPALGALLITSGVISEPEGARTRADFAKNLAGY